MSDQTRMTTEDTVVESECRRGERVERRERHGKALIYSVIGKGQRVARRRMQDSNIPHVVDHHEPVLFFLTLAILLLCVADAFFTLTILSMGGEEVNPLMKALLEIDVLLFFILKFILTAVFLVVNVVYKHFRIFNLVSGYHLIVGIFSIYLTLIIYEIFLIVGATT